MRVGTRSLAIERFLRRRDLGGLAALGLAVLGPALAVATFAVLGPFRADADNVMLRVVLLADLAYVLALSALLFQRVAGLLAARRARSVGARLHLKLARVFALVALVPTVLVAVFATLTINTGLEGWFSDRVRGVVGAALEAAEAYEAEHREALEEDVRAVAAYLEAARRTTPLMTDGDLRRLLGPAQSNVQRGLKEAYVIDGSGEIRARGERSYLFDYERPSEADLARAARGELVLIPDWQNDEFRALVPLRGFADRYLYVTREVNGRLLGLLDETKATVALYRRLEAERGRMLFEFGLLYLGFALLLILAAVWLALWFAERLSRPVGRLAGAAQRVGQGDLGVRVPEERGDDEIAMLGRIFNRMTAQLAAQRAALVETHRQTEARRRLFDSVLSSITSGVMGLDALGRVEFVNRSGEELLALSGQAVHGKPLEEAVPEFAPLLERLAAGAGEVVQEQLRVSRRGRAEDLLVRLSARRGADGRPEGFVIAFDDVTELVHAQRMAAWSDVARRIAHEIKNPLTPIRLSAERIRRKFACELGPEAVAELAQMTEVIVRQTEDLRRIVDEFSRFARMPRPQKRPEDIVGVIRGAVRLQEVALDGAEISLELPEEETRIEIDPAMLSQALVNVIKNAGEALEARRRAGAPEGWRPRVAVRARRAGRGFLIEVEDNGIGLPEDRDRLFEPYVTHREKGTGLGLAIVRKIVEEHGGRLELLDAPPGPDGHRGAMVRIILPAGAAAAGHAAGEGEGAGEAGPAAAGSAAE